MQIVISRPNLFHFSPLKLTLSRLCLTLKKQRDNEKCIMIACCFLTQSFGSAHRPHPPDIMEPPPNNKVVIFLLCLLKTPL